MICPRPAHARGAELDFDVASLEAQALDHQLGGAKHRAALRLDGGARVRGPNNRRHIELQGVAQPAVSPAAKQEQAAGARCVCVRMCEGMRERVCVCVCVCARTRMQYGLATCKKAT